MEEATWRRGDIGGREEVTREGAGAGTKGARRFFSDPEKERKNQVLAKEKSTFEQGRAGVAQSSPSGRTPRPRR